MFAEAVQRGIEAGGWFAGLTVVLIGMIGAFLVIAGVIGLIISYATEKREKKAMEAFNHECKDQQI